MIAKGDILEYADLVEEIRELKREVETSGREAPKSSVPASFPNAPSLPRAAAAHGREGGHGLRLRLFEQTQRLEHKRAEIEGFAEALPSSCQRRIVRMRMMGLTWGEIAARMGHRYSVDSVRKIFERCFQKK